MDYNVCGRIIREKRKLLIYGTCVRDEYPNIFEELSINRVPLAVCLEEVAKIMDQKMPSLKHYVIEKSRAIEISRKAVKTARYLVKVQRLLDVND